MNRDEVHVGIALNEDMFQPDAARRRALYRLIEQVGLDHVTVGDHISFHGGSGFDGFISATTVLTASERLQVLMGVYLAGLRHPMATARQLATLSQIAPGRFVMGVGVAGEDRSEVANMGVDPATRGRRLDETLALLRKLATGEPVDHEGEFFRLAGARILPAPRPRVPIVVGGAGEVAVRRTVAHGDGWLAMWCSARRYRATHAQLVAAFAEAGRQPPCFSGLNIWVGLDEDARLARTRLGEHMSSIYRLPAEKFQHVTAAGDPDAVAEFLLTYVEAGARTITLVPVAASLESAVTQSGAVRSKLRELAVSVAT